MESDGLPAELEIAPADRAGLSRLVELARAEGWLPGAGDDDAFWAQDPEGFVEARLAGRPIGGGSIVSYDGRYGFMGFFLVDAAHAGAGSATRSGTRGATGCARGSRRVRRSGWRR